MTLHAIENLDDAMSATREFLTPVNRSQWLKLALVAFFVAGPGANLNFFQYNAPSPEVSPSGELLLPDTIEPRVFLVIGAIVAGALLIGLLLLLLGSIMEFVLVESLRKETVSVREYWGRRWRQGLRLFGFRVLIGLLVFGTAAVIALAVLWPAIVDMGIGTGAPFGDVSILGLVLLIPVVLVLGILVGLVNGFTTVFVVPIMVLEDCGVLAGWRRLWPTITAHPWQYLTYAVVGFVLNILGGVVVAIVVGISVLVLLIPFGVLGIIGFVLLSTVAPVGLAVFVILALLFFLAVIAAAAIAQVPVVTYLRYFALLVLGDIDEELDLIPEQRDAVRANGE